MLEVRMAQLDMDEIGKPGKPPRHRRFPWRLWLFAVVMTAAAGAAGYYAWQLRERATTASDDASGCLTKLGKSQTEAADATTAKTGCLSSLANAIKDKKDLETQLTALSGNLNASKDELSALRSQRADAEKRLAAVEDIQKQFARMIDTGQLKVTARRGQLVLSLPSEVLFPSGIAELSRPGELAVLEVGITLKRFPDRRFLVVGHADDLPLKNSPYKDNLELSISRALNVTRFLVQAGMDARNLLPAGAGENDPVSKDRAKNRRIEIALLPAINELPPLPASLGSDTAKAEAGKAEAAPAPAKAEAPKAEAPKAEAPKAEAPKAEAPKAEAPKAEAPKPAEAEPKKP
jgi:chemotaxis protein MotB